MPVHAYTIKAGARSKLILLTARDASDGSPKAGLSHDAPGARAGFAREGEPGRPVALAEGKVGAWSPGGFVEVDPELLPGVYQFGAPDEMLAPGSARAILVLQFSGALVEPVEVDLVAFDPQDSVRLGMSALGPEERVAALRGAFPRLAAKEIAEREAMKEPD